MTAAHVGRFENPPRANWNEWPDAIRVIPDPSQGSLALNLFRTVQGVRHPLFAFLQAGGDAISDFMALPLSAPIADVKSHALDPSHVPGVGEPLEIVGFPNSGASWPLFPAGSLKATVAGAITELVHFNPPTAPGYSGGPVFDSSGRLCGMNIGFSEAGNAVSNIAMHYIVSNSGL